MSSAVDPDGHFRNVAWDNYACASWDRRCTKTSCPRCAHMAFCQGWRKYGRVLARRRALTLLKAGKIGALTFLLAVACAHSKSSVTDTHLATASQSTSTATATEAVKWTTTAGGERHENASSKSEKNIHEIVTTEVWEPRKSGPPKYTKKVVDKSTAAQADTSTTAVAITASDTSLTKKTLVSGSIADSTATVDDNHVATKTTAAPSLSWGLRIWIAGVLLALIAIWLARGWLRATIGRFAP